MAIDLKAIQVSAQRVVDFSIDYTKKHPILTSILSILFLLFIFVRSLFIFLLFAIPIFIFMIFAFKLIFHIHQENLRTAKGENHPHARKLTPSRGGRNLDKRGNSYAHAQSVRRRSSKKYQNHVCFQEDPNEKDTIYSTEDKYNNDLVDKTALVEETPKEIREVEVGDGSGLRPNRYNGERPGLESESSDEREEEDEPEDGNKAVEWTEDDQKNLMDLGFSEMERNKRLESLIAKRKARKLLSLQVRRTLLNIGRGDPMGQKNSISIPKIGNFRRSKSSEALISPTPGSAPSVLLPVHNPFDIPYDPQEEKPNLTGGFQEELVENHYNDAVFCRHESFSLGHVSQGPWELPESNSHPNFSIRTKTRDIPEFSRFKEQTDKDVPGELKEEETSQESERKQCVNGSYDPIRQCEESEKVINLSDTNKTENDSKSDRDDIHESISSSSSDVNAPFSSAHKEEILKSINFSVRKNVPVAELDTNFCRNEFFYNDNPSPFDYKGMYVHTPSMSIASDLQVEVSEVGSQMTNLSSDGGSPKEDFENNSRNGEVWVASPQLNSFEENEARSGEVRQVSEQDIMEVGFSRINQENGDISEEKMALPTHEKAQISTEELEPRLLNENNLEQPKEPPNSVDNCSANENMNDQVELVHDDQGIIDFIQHTYGEGGYTQAENDKPNFIEALGVTQSKPQHVAEGLNLTGNNNTQVTDVLAENYPKQASSSTSPRSTAEDKDPSITSVNDPVTTNSSKKGEDEKVGTAKTPKEPIKRVRLRGTKPKLISEGAVESPSSTRKKFYLMANLSFDDIYEDCQQFDQQIEKDGKSEDLKAGQTQDDTMPKSIPEESSSSLSQSTGEKSIGSGGVIEQRSDNGADIDSKTSLEKDQKTETTKGGEYFGQLERSEDVEIHSKPANIIDTSETPIVDESSYESSGHGANDNPDIVVAPILNNDKPDVDSKKSSDGNEKTETTKGGENFGKLERSEDIEIHAKSDNIIDTSETVVNDESNYGSSAYGAKDNPDIVVAPILNNDKPDVDSKKSSDGNEKIETTKGGENFGKLERSEDIEIHAKPDNIIDTSETLVNDESNYGSSAYGAKDNPDIVVAPILNNGKPDVDSKKSSEGNEKTETTKVSENFGKLERSEDIEIHAKPDNIIDTSETLVNDESNYGSSVYGAKDNPDIVVAPILNNDKPDVDSKKSSEGNEKTETTKVGANFGKLERSEDIEIHPKPDNIIDTSETLVVDESNYGSSVYGANDNPDIVVAPILNNDKKQLEISESNFTQPEDSNSSYVESLELGVERPPEAEKVTEKLNLTCDNDTKVKEIVAEVGPSETSSSMSSGNVTDDKDPSIFLQKPKRISVIPKVALDQANVSSSPSSTRKKFYLMANMSFDDIQIPEELKEEIEQGRNSPVNSTADQTPVGDSVGLKDSNESLGDENRADTASQTPVEEIEKAGTTKGVEEIRELERSENVEGLSKLDNTMDSSKSIEVIESGSLPECKANDDPDIRLATEKN